MRVDFLQRQTQRRISDRLNSRLDQIAEELRLLKVGMKPHFIHHRLDARVAQKQLHLGDGHVRDADVARQPAIDQHFRPAFGSLLALAAIVAVDAQ